MLSQFDSWSTRSVKVVSAETTAESKTIAIGDMRTDVKMTCNEDLWSVMMDLLLRPALSSMNFQYS